MEPTEILRMAVVLELYNSMRSGILSAIGDINQLEKRFQLMSKNTSFAFNESQKSMFNFSKGLALTGVVTTLLGVQLKNTLTSAVQPAQKMQTALAGFGLVINNTNKATGVLKTQLDNINAKELLKLKDFSFNISAQTQFSASDVVGFATDLASMGIRSDPAILGNNWKTSTLMVASQFAEVERAIKGTDPKTAINELGRMAMALGQVIPQKPEVFQNFANVVHKLTLSTPATISQMRTMITQMGTIPSAIMDWHTKLDVAAFFGRVSSGRSGQQITAMMQRIVPPLNAKGSSPQITALRDLGLITPQGTLKYFDNKGKFIGFDKYMEMVQKAMSKFSPEQQLSLTTALFGTTGGKAAGPLLTPATLAAYNDMIAQQEKMQSLQQAQVKIYDTYQGQLINMQTNWDNIKIILGGPILTDLTAIYARIASILNLVTRWLEVHPAMADWLAKISIALTGIALILGPIMVFMGAIGMASVGMSGLVTAFGGIPNIMDRIIALSGPFMRLWSFVGTAAIGVGLFRNTLQQEQSKQQSAMPAIFAAEQYKLTKVPSLVRGINANERSINVQRQVTNFLAHNQAQADFVRDLQSWQSSSHASIQTWHDATQQIMRDTAHVTIPPRPVLRLPNAPSLRSIATPYNYQRQYQRIVAQNIADYDQFRFPGAAADLYARDRTLYNKAIKPRMPSYAQYVAQQTNANNLIQQQHTATVDDLTQQFRDANTMRQFAIDYNGAQNATRAAQLANLPRPTLAPRPNMATLSPLSDLRMPLLDKIGSVAEFLSPINGIETMKTQLGEIISTLGRFSTVTGPISAARTALELIWDILKLPIDPITWIMLILQGLAQAFIVNISKIKASVLDAQKVLSTSFGEDTKVLDQFFDRFKGAGESAPIKIFFGVFTAIVNAFQHMFEQAWFGMATMIRGAWQIIEGSVTIGWNLVAGVISIGLDLLKGHWKAAWSDLGDVAKGLERGLSLIIRGVFNFIIIGPMQAALGAASGLFGSFIQDIADMFVSDKDYLNSGAATMFNALGQIVHTAVQYIKNEIYSLFNKLPGMANLLPKDWSNTPVVPSAVGDILNRAGPGVPSTSVPSSAQAAYNNQSNTSKIIKGSLGDFASPFKQSYAVNQGFYGTASGELAGYITPTGGVMRDYMGKIPAGSTYYSHLHGGVDLNTPIGTQAFAPFAGKVVSASNSNLWNNGWGNDEVIQSLNGKYDYQIAHLSQAVAAVGTTVKAGQLIGLTGNSGNSTGPHVHVGLEDMTSNQFIDPTDLIRGRNAFSVNVMPGAIVVHAENSTEATEKFGPAMESAMIKAIQGASLQAHHYAPSKSTSTTVHR